MNLLRSALQFILIVIFLPAPIRAQEADSPGGSGVNSRHALYVELGGQGILWSLNYEYRLLPNLGLRVGYACWNVPESFLFTPMSFRGIPIMANYITGGDASHLELGAGIMPVMFTLDGSAWFFGDGRNVSRTVVVGTGTIGYRYQPAGSGVVFRIGLVPLIGPNGTVMTGGLSLGAAF